MAGVVKEYGVRFPGRRLLFSQNCAGVEVAEGDWEQAAFGAEFGEGAARAGIWPVWYRSPLRCTYKPAAKAPPECPHTVVTSWDELGVMLRGLIKMRKCVTISV